METGIGTGTGIGFEKMDFRGIKGRVWEKKELANCSIERVSEWSREYIEVATCS